MDDVAGGDGTRGVDFSDQKEAQFWLNKQSFERRCEIVSRSALRVCANVHTFDHNLRSATIIPVFRAIITSSILGSGISGAPTTLHIAAKEASLQLGEILKNLIPDRSVGRSALHAAKYASDAAMDTDVSSSSMAAFNATYHAARSSYSTMGSDFKNLKPHKTNGPIWDGNTVPSVVQQNHLRLLNTLSSDDSIWKFWHDWYLAMWEGRFTDWDLANEVANIPNGLWEKGAEAVAAEIEKIKALRLAAALPQAERIEFNAENKTFMALPVDLTKPDLIGATLQQVEDSLEDVMASPSNGLSEASREVRVIRRTIQKYGNNPQQIEMGFVSAHAGLTRQIIVRDLPPSEENIALQTALEEGAVAIRATHSDVAENRAILTKRKFAELSPEQKDQLAEALPVLTAISDEDLANDWKHDIPALINTSMGPLPEGAPPLLGADEATRIFSRAAKIGILLRTGDIIHQIDQSATYKGARIVVTVAGLVSLGLALLVLI